MKSIKILSDLAKCVRNNPVAASELSKWRSRAEVKHKNLYEIPQLKLKRIYRNFIKKFMFNPQKVNSGTRLRRRKRIILLDGTDIALEHGKHKIYSATGIKLANDYFRNLGNQTQIIIPAMRLNPGNCDDHFILHELKEKNLLILTPSFGIEDSKGMSLDDRFMLRIAFEHDTAILSNDSFKNLYLESTDYQKVIDNRIIPFSWNKDDLLIPEKPYGHNGPSLAEILNH